MLHHLETGPTIPYTPNLFNQSRLALLRDAYRYFPMIYNHNNHRMEEGIDRDNFNIYSHLASPHQMPGSVHFVMFLQYLESMGTQQHKQLYLQKTHNC
jgi:hypothetical protein